MALVVFGFLGPDSREEHGIKTMRIVQQSSKFCIDKFSPTTFLCGYNRKLWSVLPCAVCTWNAANKPNKSGSLGKFIEP